MTESPLWYGVREVLENAMPTNEAESWQKTAMLNSDDYLAEMAREYLDDGARVPFLLFAANHPDRRRMPEGNMGPFEAPARVLRPEDRPSIFKREGAE